MQVWTCPNKCGRSFDSDVIQLPVRCGCGFIDTDGAAIQESSEGIVSSVVQAARKVARYSRSTTAWIAAGCPTRTDEEVTAIFRDFCTAGCDLFQDGTCTHKACGCQIRNSAGEKITVLGITVSAGFANNKLRRATEHCPIGKW